MRLLRINTSLMALNQIKLDRNTNIFQVKQQFTHTCKAQSFTAGNMKVAKVLRGLIGYTADSAITLSMTTE